jgi:hypothetical protein
VAFALAVATGFLVFWPAEAGAWGPVTHLVHGSQVLERITILAPALQQMLGTFRLSYLYGCIAPDIMHAKKYTRSVYTHCHCWAVGWRVVEAARSEEERAFAYGYLSHLAGDVHSHNHYVPVRMVMSYEAVALRHLYWEARFDSSQAAEHWGLLREVVASPHQACDAHVEREVERTLFTFKTNKRIFDSLMTLQRMEQWHGMVRQVAGRSRYPLPTAEVERFNDDCIESIGALLSQGRESPCQQADPTGRDALDRASRVRRKLRRLRRQGALPPNVIAELAALAGAAG